MRKTGGKLFGQAVRKEQKGYKSDSWCVKVLSLNSVVFGQRIFGDVDSGSMFVQVRSKLIMMI